MAQQRKVAIVWRGDPARPVERVPETSRLHPIAMALEAKGLSVEPIVYAESVSDVTRRRLLDCDGVLAWVDPLTDGKDRSDLDATLRYVSARGVWLGSHPDIILKMGTKEVLYRTRDVGWSADAVLYRTLEAFRREFPDRLRQSGARVLKQYRGNGGQGVWKVTLLPDETVVLQQATDRDGRTSKSSLSEFIASCATYFSGEGRLVDQAFQPRIVEGMIRAYFCANEVIGFARQFAPVTVEGAPDRNTFGLPAAKTMYPSDESQFARLREKLEREWIPKMMALLEIEAAKIPALWDADLLFGPKTSTGEDTYVLCEINASCITPFPPAAPEKIAARTVRALSERTTSHPES